MGSKNVTLSYTTPMLFSDSQYRSIVGRSWNGGGDMVVAMNGNWSANTAALYNTIYNPSNKNIYLHVSTATGTPMQVNYVIFAYNA